ncbi:Trehalose-6-phosphate hydrolase [Grimontia indica]|uniref:Alpha,alpha-phosphotrehalase n=1 Tax=Grimontia indica TaxID=1056512 RepID=R1IFM9_9GAMM|nr:MULTISPECIES: alpha,alpha-phosphotrehalase [Grimontia]EOD79531.1 Trehalose-6-phosphate hydrolase [Grimontia indica]
MSKTNEWWRSATIYQIYPKSFCDTTGSGSGDIKGIISKLDYLCYLGIDAIWITPIYQSPQIDNGYDVSDFYTISPEYGTMDDFDDLLAQAHSRGLRVIMDMVFNHTSTAHPWFQSALESKDNPYRDFYIWRDPVNGQPPNNWQSKFGDSAWELDAHSGQYYLHLFAKEQADLNWENPAVRQNIKNIMQFWAEKGVDGFRLDVINLISKQQDFPDDNEGDGRRFYTDGPKVHKYLQEMNKAIFQRYGVVTVGEMSSTSLEHCRQYSSLSGKELSMVFNFHHLKVDYPCGEKWQLEPFDFLQMKKIFRDWQQGLFNQGWNALFWCNHDQPRIVSRFGCDKKFRVESAKMLATAIHLMQGTPYIYQGEELGMTNPNFQNIDDYRDVESLNAYHMLIAKGLPKEEVLTILSAKSRDNSRTPMHWNDSKNAGFTTGTPWINCASNSVEINAKQSIEDNKSVFYHYRDLIRLRKSISIITDGDYEDLLPYHLDIFCYRRKNDKNEMVVLNNFRPYHVTLDNFGISLSGGDVLIQNYKDFVNIESVSSLTLRPFESVAILF